MRILKTSGRTAAFSSIPAIARRIGLIAIAATVTIAVSSPTHASEADALIERMIASSKPSQSSESGNDGSTRRAPASRAPKMRLTSASVSLNDDGDEPTTTPRGKPSRADGDAPKRKSRGTQVASLGDAYESPKPNLSGGGNVSWAANAGCLDSSLKSVIYQVAQNYGSVTVTSTCRSPSQNRAAGGASRSYHLQGNAADFRVHGNVGAAYSFLKGTVGGLSHYGGGLFHIDTGPRRPM